MCTKTEVDTMATIALHYDCINRRDMQMRNTKKTTSVRVDGRSHSYAKAFALAHRMSITDALVAIIGAAEDADPIQIYIHHCKDDQEVFYAAGIGFESETSDDFFIGDTLEKAEKAVADFRRKHSLDPRRFKIVRETLDIRLSPHRYEDDSKSA